MVGRGRLLIIITGTESIRKDASKEREGSKKREMDASKEREESKERVRDPSK